MAYYPTKYPTIPRECQYHFKGISKKILCGIKATTRFHLLQANCLVVYIDQTAYYEVRYTKKFRH